MWWELGKDSCILLIFLGMLIWILNDLWILDFWVFDILLTCGYFLIGMLDILLLNCHSLYFFLDRKREIVALCLILGQKWGDIHVDFRHWTLDVFVYQYHFVYMLMIILDIGYFEIHVDMWSCLFWIWIYIELFGYTTCWYYVYSIASYRCY